MIYMDLVINHTGGFFSCCTQKLLKIVDYVNKKKKIPEKIDSINLFTWYKLPEHSGIDISDIFFKEDDSYLLDLDHQLLNNVGKKKQRKLKKSNTSLIHLSNDLRELQFSNYKDIDFKDTNKLIKKYFTPSNEINKIIQTIEDKYNIIHDNTLAVYYRGTDKNKEMNLSPFNEFYKQIIKITNKNKNIKILLQSDSAKFIDYITEQNLKNVIVIDENKTSYTDKGIHNEQSSDKNYYDMLNFFSTILILSKCKYIICSSGNCSLWIMLYRGNANNVYQYLSAKEYIWGVKNKFYDEKESDYWL